MFSRREALQTGLATLAGVGMVRMGIGSAFAQAVPEAFTFETESGPIEVFPVQHASFVMTLPGLVIYNDPVGGAALYEGRPPAQLVLITHEHGDHFDLETLAAIVGENTRLITNPSVHGKLPADLQAKATAIGNGQSATVGDLGIEAIPAYNLTADRLQYHPKGRDNGYILTVGGRRVYIAGDTEDIPEMRDLEGIDVAFVPMNLPYTMDVVQASSAVAEFAPGMVFPYHYGDSDIQDFAARVQGSGAETKVVFGQWYS
jgi:L-ascorbate metabolism protein UlaG (beta-lactamase superfamily)